MGQLFWGPVVAFLLLLFTSLRREALAAALSGLIVGAVVGGAVSFVGSQRWWPIVIILILCLIVVNLAMIAAETIAARLVGGGRTFTILLCTLAAHVGYLALVFLGHDGARVDVDKLLCVLPVALVGGGAAAFGAWASRR